MDKIRCSVSNCSHNKDNECYANIVSIGGKPASDVCSTCCSSFLDKEVYGNLTNNVNSPEETCHGIECSACKCVYNENSYCTANQVEITGDGANTYFETKCSTFKEK